MKNVENLNNYTGEKENTCNRVKTHKGKRKNLYRGFLLAKFQIIGK